MASVLVAIFEVGKTACMNILNHYTIPYTLDPELAKVLVTGGATVFAGVFVYANFVTKWATDRMKDWEAVRGRRLGSPGLVCWIAGVGELTSCIFGAHLFSALYFALNGRVYLWHIGMLIGMCYTLCWMWRILVGWVRWYRRHDGRLAPLTESMIEETVHWHPPLKWTVTILGFTGVGALIECVFGDFVAGLMGLFYDLIAAFGIGAYCSIRGDLLLRALAISEVEPAKEMEKRG